MTPEQAAVTVKSATGAYTAAGAIGTFIVSLIGLIVAWVKFGPKWREVATEARDSDFKRLRAEIDGLTARVEKSELAALAASEKATRADAKLQAALTACEVLLALVEREMPEATEIGLVKRLLAQAASDDLGIGGAMRRLATMKGVGE